VCGLFFLLTTLGEDAMFTKLFLILSLILPISIFAYNPSDTAATHSFVGVKTCGMCHKSEKQGNQLGVWEKSMHSKAYETLKTEKADKIAKEKGFSTPAVQTPECLKCHTSGSNVAAEFKEAKFSIEDGVQCETCHGPGSDYKSLKVMKDKQLAMKNGLEMHDNTEEFCKSCHNPESPTFVEFNFKESWDKIKHPIPSN
jgi:hypothetical protein